jgi:hypothetical protein
MSVDHQVKLGQEDFYWRLEDFKIAFIQEMWGLGNRLDNMELRMIGMCDHITQLVVHQTIHGQMCHPLPQTLGGMTQRPPETIIMGNDATTDLVAWVESRVDKMEQNCSWLLAKNKEQAIHFAGLGIQTIAKSNAWLETIMPKHQSGLIVDMHMVFEHVYHVIKGIDTIA